MAWPAARPGQYDYAGQVRWHRSLGRLWNATVARLRRVDPDMEFFRVFESQARGALHAHAIVRVPSFSTATAAELLDAARAASTVREGLIDVATGEVLTESYS
nr:replication initiator [Agromyces laixinhei]